VEVDQVKVSPGEFDPAKFGSAEVDPGRVIFNEDEMAFGLPFIPSIPNLGALPEDRELFLVGYGWNSHLGCASRDVRHHA